VREFKGAYSGEHGDGLVRSEWIEPMIGPRLAGALAEIKALFDPRGLMNPGKIVDPPRMDDRSLFRFGPDYGRATLQTALDWSEWGGFAPAVEMCNNNGHCRKFDAGTMCPSYRATRDEQHLTRGRANTLRLALSGQFGPDALAGEGVREALSLCVGCKGCRRECPTGVDMARMKIEVAYHDVRRNGLTLRQRLIAWLPRYAPLLGRAAPLVNICANLPGSRWLLERCTGLSRHRSLPRWHRFAPLATAARSGAASGDIVLFADTFNRWFEPENLHDAAAVLRAAGYRVHPAEPADGGRPLCCGRTFLTAGLVDEARHEARRLIESLRVHVLRGRMIVGLEPSCLFTLRDEHLALGLGEEANRLAQHAKLLEEFIAEECAAERFRAPFVPLEERVLLHGHCHQWAFDTMPSVRRALALIPGLAIEETGAGCCGMAGSFGYEQEHFAVSMQMAELSLLPKVRAAASGTLVVADGTSCRHQIRDGGRRDAIHAARVMRRALNAGARQ
jgi:Fe-S oxidoreductase